MVPCQFEVVQQLLHEAFEMPMRHWPASEAALLTKYEIDHWHEFVAPSDETVDVPSDAWLTSFLPIALHDVSAFACVQLVTVPSPQGTIVMALTAPVTSRTVPVDGLQLPALQN